MRLSSQSSQFVFNLAEDFLPPEIIQTYTPILEKNWISYENVLDYLSSTIKSVSFPGISFEMPKQSLLRGKERRYKPAKNVQDIVNHDLDITFASVDADINYWLMFDILTKHYLDVEHMYVNPFTLTVLDIHRDVIYKVSFYEVIVNGLSDNKFDYSAQKVSSKDFNLKLSFNFYEVEFELNKSKVLELGSLPTIIQKI